jgi:hypothetical protein
MGKETKMSKAQKIDKMYLLKCYLNDTKISTTNLDQKQIDTSIVNVKIDISDLEKLLYFVIESSKTNINPHLITQIKTDINNLDLFTKEKNKNKIYLSNIIKLMEIKKTEIKKTDINIQNDTSDYIYDQNLKNINFNQNDLQSIEMMLTIFNRLNNNQNKFEDWMDFEIKNIQKKINISIKKSP